MSTINLRISTDFEIQMNSIFKELSKYLDFCTISRLILLESSLFDLVSSLIELELESSKKEFVRSLIIIHVKRALIIY